MPASRMPTRESPFPAPMLPCGAPALHAAAARRRARGLPPGRPRAGARHSGRGGGRVGGGRGGARDVMSMEGLFVTLVGAALVLLLVCGLVVFAVWTVRVVRRSLGMQGEGLRTVDESLELSRRAVALCEESVRLQHQT